MVKNTHHSFRKLKLKSAKKTSNSPKLKSILFIIIEDYENQKIFTSEKLKPVNIIAIFT